MTTQLKSQIYRYQLLSKNPLTPDETELYELTHLSGVVMDPNVFKILLDLQRMNVAPTAIERMLKSIVTNQSIKKQSHDETGDVSRTSSVPSGHSSIPTSHSRNNPSRGRSRIDKR